MTCISNLSLQRISLDSLAFEGNVVGLCSTDNLNGFYVWSNELKSDQLLLPEDAEEICRINNTRAIILKRNNDGAMFWDYLLSGRDKLDNQSSPLSGYTSVQSGIPIEMVSNLYPRFNPESI